MKKEDESEEKVKDKEKWKNDREWVRKREGREIGKYIQEQLGDGKKKKVKWVTQYDKRNREKKEEKEKNMEKNT